MPTASLLCRAVHGATPAADIVCADMTRDRKPQPSEASGADQGWAVLSYLLAGMLVWGGIGWLLDDWLDIPKHLGAFVGMVFGAGLGLYLIVKRLGQPEDPNNDQGEGRER